MSGCTVRQRSHVQPNHDFVFLDWVFNGLHLAASAPVHSCSMLASDSDDVKYVGEACFRSAAGEYARGVSTQQSRIQGTRLRPGTRP